MPAPSNSDDQLSLLPLPPSPPQQPIVYPLRHSLSSPISRIAISWSRGNSLRLSLLPQPSSNDGNHVNGGDDSSGGGSVVEVKLSAGNSGIDDDSQWRRIVYGSVAPFAMFQNRKNSVFALSKLSLPNVDWWEYVMEYSKEINSLLGTTKSMASIVEDPRRILTVDEEPTSLKAAWELLEIFYADKQSQTWLPERLVDWLADYDNLFSETQHTVYSKLLDLQHHILHLQVIEDDPKYWDCLSSALSLGWLDIVVKLLRLHGSYELDQIGKRETENGLVEAVVVLVSKMPRLRPELQAGRLGECYRNKSDFVKGWETWRARVTKLECSSFWVDCGHQKTREGLRKILQIMLGNTEHLSATTYNWVELYISHFLYIRPFTVGLESLYGLAQKCIQLKPVSHPHSLMGLMVGILGENTEVVLAECSRAFGPWMVTHAIELLTAGNDQSEILLHEVRQNLGGVSIEELHRLVYAQVLASHQLTWQIAPVYLTSCKPGIGMLEILLYRQPVHFKQGLLKSLEICRLYELDDVSSNIMKIAGIHHWKHGRKGSGIFWLQQAQDEIRLNKIAQQLFDFVGKSISEESFKQWEGLIELLGSDTRTAGGLEFLHKYRDFKRSLQQAVDGKASDAARQAVESLIMLMKNSSTPQRFWLPLLYDSLKLLTWREGPLLDVAQTNLLLNKLQELSIARMRPDYVEADLPTQALSSVRLALATNLGRAILEEQ
ncbi:nuclear pore complex protein NUP85-like [Chenopodium quinoa]|uniref:nuclear pore complex protein NUP85-like n=1 Tax=Chenopodium quinoa TaxID=63459 RepID=UPI000B785D33|nr:nuclear pore complex protein NUP85-like [Chenopodium quinoa]